MAMYTMEEEQQDQEQLVSEEELSDEEDTNRISRTWGVKSMLVAASVVLAMGASIGVYIKVSTQPLLPTSDGAERPEEVHLSSASMRDASAASPGWVGTAPVGSIHPEASPRSLSAIEMFQHPRFTSKMADQLKKLEKDFHGEEGDLYSSPEEQAQAHAEVAHAVGSFIGNLSALHPQVALLLHECQLDGSQQNMAHNILDHLSDKKIMRVGVEVTSATIEGGFEGKKGIKRRLQAKLGPRMNELRRIRNEIVPRELRGSEDDDSAHSHFDMLRQVVKGEDVNSIGRVKGHLKQDESEESERRLQTRRLAISPWKVILGKKPTSVAGGLLITLLGHLIPGKVMKYISTGVGDIMAIISCTSLNDGDDAWVACAINLVGAVMNSVFTFI